MNPIIELSQVDLGYFTFNQGVNSVKDIFTSLRLKQIFYRKNVLTAINLKINEGEVLGIIGKNGSGKTTLLKAIAGILSPTAGEIRVRKKISPMLSLGIGIEMELSGYENINLIASIMGFTKKEIREKTDGILSFSELDDRTLQSQVKTYSTGMIARLAFSIALTERPEILLIDEVLAVGDGAFWNKCMDKILEIKRSGSTILFVSHSLQQVEEICTRAICLHNGEIASQGIPSEVISYYEKKILNL